MFYFLTCYQTKKLQIEMLFGLDRRLGCVRIVTLSFYLNKLTPRSSFFLSKNLQFIFAKKKKWFSENISLFLQ
jgi:hypothetical protein